MSLAVMYLDRDGFKEVKDGYGHSTGDALLKLVGERLLSVVRGYAILSSRSFWPCPSA